MTTDSAAGHYVWWTKDDLQVRSSHAARDGKIFNWNKPPKGGHPGQDYGCRCRAIPVTAIEQLPPEFQNPENPVRYKEIVESGLSNKFNKMVENKNKFVAAHNTWFDQDQRIKAGERVLLRDQNMTLAVRAKARRDAANSAADFEEAARAKALANNKPLAEEKPPISRQKPDLSNKGKVKNLVRKEALDSELDPDVVEKLVQAESGFRKDAVDKKSGATGLMQIMPATAELIAVKTAWTKDQILHDPEINIKAGIRLLNDNRKLFQGKVKDEDLPLAGVAAYKTSPQIINKAIEQTRKEKPRIEEVLKQKAFPEKAKKSIEKIQDPAVLERYEDYGRLFGEWGPLSGEDGHGIFCLEFNQFPMRSSAQRSETLNFLEMGFAKYGARVRSSGKAPPKPSFLASSDLDS